MSNEKEMNSEKTPEYYIDQYLICSHPVEDEQGDIVFIMRKYADQQTASLRAELAKQKEQLVNMLETCHKSLCTYGEHPLIDSWVNNLIKKSNSQLSEQENKKI